ncbi:MAG: hypothetical protein Hals2KO_21680 [Halioglobus sp.]
MVDTRLTDETELTEVPQSDDWLYLVDVSDTADDVAGSGRKVQLGNILSRVPFETIANVAAGEFDFSSIPGGGKRLVFVLRLRGEAADVRESLRCFLNADTTNSNYQFEELSTESGTVNGTSGNSAYCGVSSADNSPADAYSTLTIAIEDYESASTLKVLNCSYRAFLKDTPSVTLRAGEIVCASSLTDAITRVRIRSHDFGVNDLLGEATGYIEF